MSARKFIHTCLMKTMKEKENIKKFISVDVTDSNKQDSYFSDLKSVKAIAEIENGRQKEYNLIVKLGKTNKALRESSTVIKNLYEREIFLYNKILPKFAQFEEERGIRSMFDNAPKCYGTYMDDEEGEMIILDDLEKNYSYMLDPRDQPIERSKFEMLLKIFGKWHAISGAMAAQKAADYNKIAEKLEKPLATDITEDGINIYTGNMRMIYENVLDFQLNEAEKQQWKTLESRIPSIMKRVIDNDDEFKVVIHGDIHANNFMFKKSTPAIMDWQFAARNSPVYDLSDLLYTCATEEDISDLNRIFEIYHKSFSTHLKMLGIGDPSKIYSMSDLMADWDKIAEYGVMRSFTIMKNTFSDVNNIPDIAENAEKGRKFSEAFTNIDIPDKDKKRFADRVLYIFKSATAHGVV